MYPAAPIKGDLIQGLTSAARVEGATLLYAGVTENESGQTFVGGGRVLNIVGQADNL
ncbi:MAG: phosphoribosylamine--glycine ligase, partial [Verrucomicrobia bacterium]|nr:phosphoribosylamine--glycine ligase [Deltaproteobacteria bacterium]